MYYEVSLVKIILRAVVHGPVLGEYVQEMLCIRLITQEQEKII